MTYTDAITRITYSREDHDFSVSVTIDEIEVYLGSRPTRHEAEGLSRDYRYNYFVDMWTPEKAARVAMEASNVC
jgi:hypothetical protein